MVKFPISVMAKDCFSVSGTRALRFLKAIKTCMNDWYKKVLEREVLSIL